MTDPAPAPVQKQAARASADSTDTDLKMDQGPAKSDDTTGTGAGLVSNAAPLTVRDPTATAAEPTLSAPAHTWHALLDGAHMLHMRAKCCRC